MEWPDLINMTKEELEQSCNELKKEILERYAREAEQQYEEHKLKRGE